MYRLNHYYREHPRGHEDDSPTHNRGWTVVVESLHRTMVGDVQQPLFMLLGAAGLLLVITCANGRRSAACADHVPRARAGDSGRARRRLPYAAAPAAGLTLLIRTGGAPTTLARPAQHAVRQIDPGLALAKIRTFDQFLREVVAAPRFNATLLATFAFLGFVLAAVGIYGVTAYSVAQRTSEIGVRVALGAGPSDVFRTVVAPGIATAAAGTLAGIACAIAAARLLGGVILGVDAWQPSIFIGGSTRALCGGGGHGDSRVPRHSHRSADRAPAAVM